VAENNRRSVLMSPAGRKPPILVIEGRPDRAQLHEARARARSSLSGFCRPEGKERRSQNYVFVQAARTDSGVDDRFPGAARIVAYDALVVANVGRRLLHARAARHRADFVAERGGGLLVLGGRSFAVAGLSGAARRCAARGAERSARA